MIQTGNLFPDTLIDFKLSHKYNGEKKNVTAVPSFSRK